LRFAHKKLKGGTKAGAKLTAPAPVPSANSSIDDAELLAWRPILDAIGKPVSIHSVNGEIVFANSCLTDMYGESEREEGIKRFEGNELKRVGEKIFEVSIHPIFDDNGQSLGFIRSMDDVTERVRLGERLIRSEQLATLGQMVNGIAHDIGTPLNIISGYCEYLMMKGQAENKISLELSTILQQTRRIADYIRQMLDLARPAQERVDAIELKSLLNELIEISRHHLRKNDITAGIDYAEPPAVVYGDAQSLRQAFFNLILNAISLIGRGGNIKLSVPPSDEPGYVKIIISGLSVSGDEIDLSKAVHDLLANKHITEGEGIGLFLAKSLLDKAGARLGASLAEGSGRGLVVYLPAKAM